MRIIGYGLDRDHRYIMTPNEIDEAQQLIKAFNNLKYILNDNNNGISIDSIDPSYGRANTSTIISTPFSNEILINILGQIWIKLKSLGVNIEYDLFNRECFECDHGKVPLSK